MSKRGIAIPNAGRISEGQGLHMTLHGTFVSGFQDFFIRHQTIYSAASRPDSLVSG